MLTSALLTKTEHFYFRAFRLYILDNYSFDIYIVKMRADLLANNKVS